MLSVFLKLRKKGHKKALFKQYILVSYQNAICDPFKVLIGKVNHPAIPIFDLILDQDTGIDQFVQDYFCTCWDANHLNLEIQVELAETIKFAFIRD